MSYVDNSNATTVGIISYDYSPTGILEITATKEQADAIVTVFSVNQVNQETGEISTESTKSVSGLTVVNLSLNSGTGGEISLATV